MKVCIYGAGAIGSHLALRLARGGADVSAIARGAQLAALVERGIEVRTRDGVLRETVTARENASTLGAQDVVIVSVKAPALPSVAAGIGALLADHTRVVFVMNGIPWWYFHGVGGDLEGRRLQQIDPGDAMWRAVGPERTVGSTIFSACSVVQPGVVNVVSSRTHLTLGNPDGSNCEVADALLAMLKAGGMDGEFVPRIREAVWSKLLVNLSMGPLAVLTQTAQGIVFNETACQQALRSLLAEGAAIAAAYGYRAHYDPEMQLATLGKSLHKPSLLQDLEAGRPMEIDAVINAPLELARLAGVSTPVLDLLASLVRLRARRAGLYA